MKQYKVTNVAEEGQEPVFNLVNVDDPYDYVMCAEYLWDDMVGLTVGEDEFYVKENQYVDDNVYGIAPFAYPHSHLVDLQDC